MKVGGAATSGEGGVDPTPLLSSSAPHKTLRPARGGNGLGTGTMLLAVRVEVQVEHNGLTPPC